MDSATLQNLILYSSFAAATATVLFVLQAFLRDRDPEADKLKALKVTNRRASDLENPAPVSPELMEQFVPILSKFKYLRERIENQQVRLRLAQAGFSDPTAPAIYVVVRLVVLIAGALGGLSFGSWRWGPHANALLAVAIGAGLGMLLPDLYLGSLAKSRRQRIIRSLPEALDLMVIAAEIGHGIDAVMTRVARDLAGRSPDLAMEFSLYNAQLRLGRNRREALRDLGMRAGVDDLNAFAAILAQADRFGSSLVVALRQLSDSMRIKRRQQAEEKAQKTAVKLLFPLVLFIFPGIFVVLVGPAAISLINDIPRVN